jgi:hypothetical protein
MPTSANEAKVNTVLSLLAGESFDSARTKSMTVAIRHGLSEDEGVHSPVSVHRKQSRRMIHPAAPAEGKKRRKRLRRSSGLEQDGDPTTSLLGGGPASTNFEDVIGGCDDVKVGGRVLDEDEEEEEEEVPLIHNNIRNSRSSDIPMQALSGLSLQGLIMSATDHALEEIMYEDLLSEPPEVESSIVRSEVPDDVPLAGDPVGLEITRTVSHSSSTLESGLVHKDMLALDVAGQSHTAPLGTTEGALASEGAAKDDPAPEGGAEDDPTLEGGAEDNLAPKDVGPGSSSAASIYVHVGSPLVQSEEPVVTNLSTTLVGPVTLDTSDPDVGNLPPANGAEVSQSDALNIIPVNAPSTSSASILPALGLPLFLSNLQVSRPLFHIVHADKRVLLLIF